MAPPITSKCATMKTTNGGSNFIVWASGVIRTINPRLPPLVPEWGAVLGRPASEIKAWRDQLDNTDAVTDGDATNSACRGNGRSPPSWCVGSASPPKRSMPTGLPPKRRS
jgi:hypothetical protein